MRLSAFGRSGQFLVVLWVLGSCSAPGMGRAQPAWSSEQPWVPPRYDRARTLNGHLFMPFLGLPWPFVITRVGSLTGVGKYELKSVPVIGLGLIRRKSQLFTLSQEFRTDVALTRWLGLSARYEMGNAVGINHSGFLNLGLNYAVGGMLGLVFRLAQGKTWYLSARIDGEWQHAEAAVPNAATTRISKNGTVHLNVGSLTRSGNLSQGFGALMAAFSPHRMLGLQGSLGFDAAHVAVGRASGHIDHLILGSGASVRFNSMGVPAALLLGGNLQIEVTKTERVFFSTLINNKGSVIGVFEPGVFYSDPKYVDVGLSTSLQFGHDNHRYQAVLVLNHFW